MNRNTIRLPAKPSLPGLQLHRYWFKPCLFMLGPRWSKKGFLFLGRDSQVKICVCVLEHAPDFKLSNRLSILECRCAIAWSLILKPWFAWKTLRNSLRPQSFWSLIGFHLYNTSKSRLSGKGPRVLRVGTRLLAHGIELWLLTKPPVDVYCLMTSALCFACCVLGLSIRGFCPITFEAS